jgi:AmmeMemoRadiSam system protein B
VLTAARLLGAARATLVRYATSGDVTGDRDEVVGYAGVIVE